MLMKILGHQVHTASDGEQALSATREFGPEVILLDIGLPKLNGYEVCRRIRQQPGGDKIFIIILSVEVALGWVDIRRLARTRVDIQTATTAA